MTDRRERDAALEKLLARSLREIAPPGDCPDAALAAAYCDRVLSREEAARLESHFASCGRCQALLAALVRTDAAAAAADAAAPRPGWRGRLEELILSLAAQDRLLSWRWLAPLATAAVVMLAIWVVRPGPVDEALPVEPAGSAEGIAATRTAPAATPAAPREDQARRERALAPEPATVPPTESAAAPGVASVAEEPAAGRVALAPGAAAAETAGGVAGGRVLAGGTEPAPPPVEPGRRAASAALRADAIDAAGAAATLTIRSPAPSRIWRVPAPGVVEGSTDGGMTWRIEMTDAGAELLAGSAPRETVCWIVGRGGVVLRTGDGQEWEVLTGPAQTDLIAVEAADDRSASVTTAGGVRYQTTDGGSTWIEIRD